MSLAALRGNSFIRERQYTHMVTQVERNDVTWHTCETCGLMFDDEDDATEHEQRCDEESPSYIQ